MKIKTKLNLVFGGTGLVGQSLRKKIKNNKKFIFLSKQNENSFNYNLNKSFVKFPYKEVNLCFFFASPRIIKRNLKYDIFNQEFKWLKKVIENIKINKLIYLSSSSVYYQNNHVVGSNKIKCEKLILQNKKKFNNFQIWRPFNLLGSKYYPSDHFYNILYKRMFIEKKVSCNFDGNFHDKRGYSSVDNFVNVMLRYSQYKKEFIKDYGNQNLIKSGDIINLFNKEYLKKNNRLFKFKFLSNKRNVNKIKEKKNNIYSREDTIKIFERYLKNSLNAKKL